MKLILAIVFLLTAFIKKSYAQFYFYDKDHYDTPLIYEFGGSMGVMNCFTDLGGNSGRGTTFAKDINIGNSNFNGSIYLGALYKYALGLRLEGTFGEISAYDSILKSVASTAQGRYQRNLHFRSKISEISLVAEFHIRFILRSFLYEDDLNREDEPPRLSPYIAAGIGYFSHNPQAMVRNEWVDLQPLSLEGQGFAEYPNRKTYNLSQFNFPLGLGIKYELSHKLNMRLEYLNRFVDTDYLDDVSTRYINANVFQNHFSGIKLQNALDLSRNDRTNPGGPTGMYRKTEGGIRGDPSDNDSYFTFNLKLGLIFGRQSMGGSSRSRMNGTKCPTRF